MLAVACGLAVLGGASFVHLGVAGHLMRKTPGHFGAMSLVWSIVFSIGIGGFTSPLAYASILTIAPVLSVVATLPAVLRVVRHPAPDGDPADVGWAELTSGLGLLLVSSLLAQLVVNIGVVNVKILAPGE